MRRRARGDDRSTPAHFALMVGLAALGCTPGSDLDAYGRGRAGGGAFDPSDAGGRSDGSGGAGANASFDAPTQPSAVPVGSAPPNEVEVEDLPLVDPEGASPVTAPERADAGFVEPPAPPGATADAGSPEPPDDPPRALGPLPNDLIDAPVAGEIVFFSDAEWEVNSTFEPTFEVHTPTASYWVVKPLGTIVSLEDRTRDSEQWIAFSSGFRPLRGIPAFAPPPDGFVSTTVHEDSQTPTHLRLIAESTDQAWKWTWDFYVTHVTLTLERAPVSISLGYRGVPAGSLGSDDRLVFSDGSSQGARNSFVGDLDGPAEWVYLADTTLKRSLFAVRHADDARAEHYQVRDNDSAHLSFVGGDPAELPVRFSFGLIDATAHDDLKRRVEFVDGAMR